MTDGQNNFTNMVDAMLAMMQKFIAIWTGNAKVAAAVAAVTSTNTAIKATAGSQSQVNQGPTTNKHTLWITAAAKAEHVCSGLKSYADDNNDAVLAAAVHFTYPSLVRGTANDAAMKMQIIHDKAAAINIALLTPFQVIASDITDLQTAINNFTVAAPMKRVMVSSGAAATSQLAALFTTQRGQLKKLDHLVNNYKIAQPAFIDNFVNSRKIINLGKTQMAEELHLIPNHFEVIFEKKFLEGDTFTIRNHSDMAKIRVFLSDSSSIPDTTAGVVIDAKTEIKLTIPTGFKMPFGHSLIVLNEATLDDAHVTVVLAHGMSQSKAGNETATKLKKTKK